MSFRMLKSLSDARLSHRSFVLFPPVYQRLADRCAGIGGMGVI
jgi:hypothetical protein